MFGMMRYERPQYELLLRAVSLWPLSFSNQLGLISKLDFEGCIAQLHSKISLGIILYLSECSHLPSPHRSIRAAT